MAWISAVNMDALSGKRHFRVWVRDTQADATFDPSFEPSKYICWKSGYWDDNSWDLALKMDESVNDRRKDSVLFYWWKIAFWRYLGYTRKRDPIWSQAYKGRNVTNWYRYEQEHIIYRYRSNCFSLHLVQPMKLTLKHHRVRNFFIRNFVYTLRAYRERGGSMVECRTPEREDAGSKPTAAVLCPLSKTLYSPKVLVNYPGSGGSVPTWLKNCWLGR